MERDEPAHRDHADVRVEIDGPDEAHGPDDADGPDGLDDLEQEREPAGTERAHKPGEVDAPGLWGRLIASDVRRAPVGRRYVLSWPMQAGLVVAAVGAMARLWQLMGRDPLWWGDSDDYLATAQSSWFSLGLWAGERPPAVPVALKLVGGEDAGFVYLQVALAVGAWAALAASVATVLPADRRGWLAVGAVVVASLATPVTMWERSVLSESLAMSCLVLMLAASIQLARRVTGWRVAIFLAALAGWLTVRDSHASVAMAVAVAFAVWFAVGRSRFDRQRAVLAAGVVVLAAVAMASATHGHRYSFPLRNVFAARILPYPDRVEWFADHGMPQAEAFADTVVPEEPGEPPIRWVGEDDPALQDWVAWVDSDGRQAFVRWMLTHPDYLLVEPWREPERTFNDADGDRSFYAPLDMRTIALVTGLSFPPRAVAVVLAVAAGAWAVHRRRWRSPLFVVGVACAALAAPHGLLSWHSDAMEAARHLVVPVVQFHLGVLLMVAGALLSDPQPPDEAEPTSDTVTAASG
ncbi:MAG: hypothetical protein ACRD2C_20265 [Acidimicrobiales bacterium]